MCKCDGIEAIGLAAGQEATINAYGKVEGVETLYAKIPTMTFFLYKSTGGTTVELIDQSGVIPTTLITNTQTLNRYMATWKLKLDSNIDRSATYRIQAKLSCSRKTALAPIVQNQTSRVLAETTQNTSFFGNIINFFANLFGLGSNNQVAPKPTPVVQTPKGDQLKLGTFYPAKVTGGDNCTFIRFQFD